MVEKLAKAMDRGFNFEELEKRDSEMEKEEKWEKIREAKYNK